MRKKLKMLINSLFVGATFTLGCTNTKKLDGNTKGTITSVDCATTANEIKYKDGDFEVTTDKDYEGYYCKAKVTIKNSKITNVEWNIYDSNNKIFDEKYEEVFAGNSYYQQQCRDDLKGSKAYGPKLVKVQNIENVDTVSGATWSNAIFKTAISLALEKAKIL